jgi:hypothetical protein
MSIPQQQQQLALAGVDAALKLVLEVLPQTQVMHLVKETLLPLECVVKDEDIVETPQGYRLTLQPLGTCLVQMTEKPAPNTFFTLKSGLTSLAQKVACFRAEQNQDTGWVSVPLRRPTSWGATATATVATSTTSATSGATPGKSISPPPAASQKFPHKMPQKFPPNERRRWGDMEASWRQASGKGDEGTTKGTCPKGSWRST